MTKFVITANGEQITPGRLGSHVHELVARAEMPSGKRGSYHLFRHTYATLMLEGGCDVRHLQEMLGHSKLETTALYTRVSLNHLKQAQAKYHLAKKPQRKLAG